MLPFALPSPQEQPQIVFSPLLNKREVRLATQGRRWKGKLILIVAATLLTAALGTLVVLHTDHSGERLHRVFLVINVITFLFVVSVLTVAHQVVVLRSLIAGDDVILLSNGSTSELYFAQLDRINRTYTRLAAHQQESLKEHLFLAVVAMVRQEQIMRQPVLPDGSTYSGLEDELRLMRKKIIAHIDTFVNPPTR
jgi:hypothetical protein